MISFRILSGCQWVSWRKLIRVLEGFLWRFLKKSLESFWPESRMVSDENLGQFLVSHRKVYDENPGRILLSILEIFWWESWKNFFESTGLIVKEILISDDIPCIFLMRKIWCKCLKGYNENPANILMEVQKQCWLKSKKKLVRILITILEGFW